MSCHFPSIIFDARLCLDGCIGSGMFIGSMTGPHCEHTHAHAQTGVRTALQDTLDKTA
jgi:hypothetical protein